MHGPAKKWKEAEGSETVSLNNLIHITRHPKPLTFSAGVTYFQQFVKATQKISYDAMRDRLLGERKQRTAPVSHSHLLKRIFPAFRNLVVLSVSATPILNIHRGLNHILAARSILQKKRTTACHVDVNSVKGRATSTVSSRSIALLPPCIFPVASSKRPVIVGAAIGCRMTWKTLFEKDTFGGLIIIFRAAAVRAGYYSKRCLQFFTGCRRH